MDDLALEPIREREKSLKTVYAQDQEEYVNLKDAWDRQRKQALGPKGSLEEKVSVLESIGPEPEPPLQHLLTCPEPTFEGLTKLFAIGQPSMGLFSSEGGQFLGGHGMSSDHRLKTAAGLSHLWDGQPIRRVRAGDGSYELAGRRLSLHLLVQPGVAQKVLSDPLLADQGTLSRLLVAAPEPRAGTRKWREPTAESQVALERYKSHLGTILSTQLPLADGKRNELLPRRLPLSATARNLWINFADWVEEGVLQGRCYEQIKAFANKLPELATRLAAVLTLVRDTQATQIGEEDLARGIELATFYAGEAIRLFRDRQDGSATETCPESPRVDSEGLGGFSDLPTRHLPEGATGGSGPEDSPADRHRTGGPRLALADGR